MSVLPPLGLDAFRAAAALGAAALVLAYLAPALVALVGALGAIAVAAWAAQRGTPPARSVVRYRAFAPVALVAFAVGELWTIGHLPPAAPPYGAAMVEGGVLLLGWAAGAIGGPAREGRV